MEDIVHVNKDNFRELGPFLRHSYDTGEIAKESADKLSLDAKESAISGYFHDIGRCFTKDKKYHTFHEVVGARYFEAEGVKLGITDSQEQCDRMAQSFRSHFAVYEQFMMPEYSQWLPGLRDTNPDLLLPKSWNELIMVYAELTNIDGNRISFEERIADIKERDIKNKNPRLKAIEKAEPRLYIIKEDLEDALQNSEIDTSKYTIL